MPGPSPKRAAASVRVAIAVLAALALYAGASSGPAEAQGYGGYYYYNGRSYSPWPPACPYRHHFECWTNVGGYRSCGCRPDWGLYWGF